MKKSLLFAATTLVLSMATSAAAHDQSPCQDGSRDDHAPFHASIGSGASNAVTAISVMVGAIGRDYRIW